MTPNLCLRCGALSRQLLQWAVCGPPGRGSAASCTGRSFLLPACGAQCGAVQCTVYSAPRAAPRCTPLPSPRFLPLWSPGPRPGRARHSAGVALTASPLPPLMPTTTPYWPLASLHCQAKLSSFADFPPLLKRNTTLNAHLDMLIMGSDIHNLYYLQATILFLRIHPFYHFSLFEYLHLPHVQKLRIHYGL